MTQLKKLNEGKTNLWHFNLIVTENAMLTADPQRNPKPARGKYYHSIKVLATSHWDLKYNMYTSNNH